MKTLRSHRKNSDPIRIPLPIIPKWAIIGATIMLLFGSGGMLYAAHREENDAFCASCHSEPETTYFQRSQDAVNIDLASFHQDQGTRCIDCHSGRGVPGRIGGIMVGAGDLVAYSTGNAQQPAPLTHEITNGHCLKCHSDVTHTRDFNRHFHAFLGRWEARDSQAGSCVGCHSGHTTDGDTDLAYLQKERATQVCRACHSSLGG